MSAPMQAVSQGVGHAPAAAEDPSARRACDQCRMRKIRCDKDWPCSNCRTAKRTCTSTGAGQRPREARQRVLISSQYERKIDQIEARLGNIEALLQKLASGIASPDHVARLSHTPQTGPSSVLEASSTIEGDESDDESAFGGDAGLAQHTAFASDFLENAMERTSLLELSPAMDSALANLRQLVEMQKERSISHGPRFPLQKPIPEGGLGKLSMPPIEAVVPLLKETKNTPPTLFTFFCALVGLSDFSGLCKSVYFATEDFSDATFAIVNAGLYNLFAEQSTLATDQTLRDQYGAYTRICQANLETCIANLPLFLSAKIENVQALFLGTLYAIDMSRPSVAWQLTSNAAQLCQTGGYHRAECLSKDPPLIAQVKTILFWQVYTMDKGLSLRLGRASVIQDYDISIPRDFNFVGFPHLEESRVPEIWLKTSSLQGRLYEQLYSPAALASSQAEITNKAQKLAAECRTLEVEVTECKRETVAYLKTLSTSELIQAFIGGDEAQFYVTMTLVYRAIPAPEGSPSRFSQECLASARRAIQCHHESLHMLEYGQYVKLIYVHWALMLTPFAPFFVLFCHAIETSDMDDLKIIQDFADSLEQLRGVSETAEKLIRLYQVMRDVAVVYLETKAQQQQDQTMIPIGDEFDMYLSQLGVMPTEDHPMTQPPNPLGMALGGPATQAADWFQGSRAIFGLLEEDSIPQMEAGRWT